MTIHSTVAKQTGKPLMIFNALHTSRRGNERVHLAAVTLGVMDGFTWKPTEESEETIGRFNSLMAPDASYTVLHYPPDFPVENVAKELFRFKKKTPSGCAILICVCDLPVYKALYYALNVDVRRNLLS